MTSYIISLKKNKELGESYPEERAIEIGKSCYRYSMENEHDAEIEIKTELKTQWDIIRNRLSTKEAKDSAKKKINELQEQLGSDITQWGEIEKKSTTVTKKQG